MSEPQSSPFALSTQQSGTVAVAQSRAAQEVQAAMIIAKKFERNEERAIERIRRSCQRRSLAEVACYAYPRGNTTITGPSIRLAECLAQNWGNVDFGIVELEQKDGESAVMAYAWDLETNTRESKVFQVKHERRVGKGDNFRIDRLSDPRDIYEMVANQGARRLRACILGVIPGDIVEIAMDECEKTLSKNSEPLIDRVRKMAAAFNDFGVTVAMLEVRLGHKLDATIEQELVNLRKIYTSLKDGMGKREDFFDVNVAEASRPQFEGDEKAEAAAGLAPEQPKGKSKAKAKAEMRGEGASSEPHKLASPGAIPGPATTPAPTDVPPDPAEPRIPPADAPVIDRVLYLCGRDGINETEVLEILKRKKLARPEWDQLLEVNDEHLKDVISSWDVVSAQVRIDRKAAAK